MPTTLPPPTVAWNSWNLGSGSAAAAGPLFSLAGGSRPWPSPALPPSPASPARSNPPFLSLFFWGGCVCGGLGRLGLCVWCGTGALGPFLSDAGGMQLIQWAAV